MITTFWNSKGGPHSAGAHFYVQSHSRVWIVSKPAMERGQVIPRVTTWTYKEALHINKKMEASSTGVCSTMNQRHYFFYYNSFFLAVRTRTRWHLFVSLYIYSPSQDHLFENQEPIWSRGAIFLGVGECFMRSAESAFVGLLSGNVPVGSITQSQVVLIITAALSYHASRAARRPKYPPTCVIAVVSLEEKKYIWEKR